ncbi:MAG: hypothetical protein ACLUNZ_05155 [Evtepia sp.]
MGYLGSSTRGADSIRRLPAAPPQPRTRRKGGAKKREEGAAAPGRPEPRGEFPLKELSTPPPPGDGGPRAAFCAAAARFS